MSEQLTPDRIVEEHTARGRKLVQTDVQVSSRAMKILGETFDEYREPNWDGYDADPISDDSIRAAAALLETLPTWLPRPEVGVTPDGEVTLDWGEHDEFSVIIGGDGMLSFTGHGHFMFPMGSEDAATQKDADPTPSGERLSTVPGAALPDGKRGFDGTMVPNTSGALQHLQEGEH